MSRIANNLKETLDLEVLGPNATTDEKRAYVRRALTQAYRTLDQTDLRQQDAERLSGSLEPFAPERSTARGVLVTGATGFFGSFMVAELLARSDRKLFCLVRASDEAHAFSRIRSALTKYGLYKEADASRIVALPGDVVTAKFGLSDDAYARLDDAVGVVLHAAAAVKFHFKYSDVREPNVTGTQNVLRFCGGRRSKPFHFVSTLGAFYAPQFAGRRVSEADDLEAAGAPGYVQSKWVGEVLTSEARKKGLPAVTYRAPWIGWHSQTGAHNASDFVCRFLAAVTQMRCAPRPDVAFHVAPVEWVAECVRRIMFEVADPHPVYHLSLDRPLALSTWTDTLRGAGVEVSDVDYPSWRATVASWNANSPLRQFLPVLPLPTQTESAFLYASMLKPPAFERTATIDSLGDFGARALYPDYCHAFNRVRGEWDWGA